MTSDELRQIVANGESSTIEFKTQDVHPGSLAEEITALANFEGGIILIGIADNQTVAGCTRPDLEEFVVNVCRNGVKPAILPRIEWVAVHDKRILAITVPRGETAHCTSAGRYFIRVGSTKQAPTQHELIRLFQHKKQLQFDETPVLNAPAGAIDIKTISAYLERLGHSPIDESSEESMRSELLAMSVLVAVEGGVYPTLGGLLAFGKEPQRHFPSFSIMCGAYDGSGLDAPALREKEAAGTLADQIEDAMAFFRFVIGQDHDLENNTRRRDVFNVPLEALREAIVNAVCHRDYTVTGSAIRVFVFDDRIEIRSPGSLPNTLTLRNIEYRQYTRNQTIASFLTGSGYMERRGKGIARMRKLSADRGCACEFALTPDADEFVVTFRAEAGVMK